MASVFLEQNKGSDIRNTLSRINWSSKETNPT